MILVGIIGFKVSVLIGYHLNIRQASSQKNILFIRLLIDSIMLAFCSRLSIVSRTVNMTLQAAAGTTIQTSSCLARDLQRISPTPSVQRHCLSFLAPRRLGKTHAPSITAERRASHETNPNKSCLLDLLASDAQNGDDNPQSDLTCIGHCWKMRCCRGA